MSADLTNSSGPALGVCVMPLPPTNAARAVNYPEYIHEVLAHAGVFYARVEPSSLGDSLAGGLRVLVTIGEIALEPSAQKQLADWVAQGGRWLSIGGVCGMNEVLGAELAPPAYKNWSAGASLLGEGYTQPSNRSHRALAHVDRPLHFFGGLSVRTTSATILATMLDAHGRETPTPVVLEHAVGTGRAILIAVDVTGTIVRVQQGLAVTRDGVPAPDGTAPVADGVLKSDDGCALDWILDREPVPGVEGLQAFLRPAADLWRELLLRAIFHLASEAGVMLPVLWLYPRGLPALAHLSHDTDGNDPAKARALLRLLHEERVQSTWCVIAPGYDASTTAEIVQAGHELAMHYDALEHPWSREEFAAQQRELAARFAEQPVTNKNHYLRWEGDCEFFDWCAGNGIELDQSKGPSKTGGAGFNFGTCHPYFPVTFEGRSIDVLELPTLTQDLVIFAPQELLAPLAAATRAAHGVLHLLFHPSHAGRYGWVASLQASIRHARAIGMEWWTARQISDWERARRTINWNEVKSGRDSVELVVSNRQKLEQATLLWLNPGRGGRGKLEAAGEARPVTPHQAWGFEFSATTITVHEPLRITFSWEAEQA